MSRSSSRSHRTPLWKSAIRSRAAISFSSSLPISVRRGLDEGVVGKHSDFGAEPPQDLRIPKSRCVVGSVNGCSTPASSCPKKASITA